MVFVLLVSEDLFPGGPIGAQGGINIESTSTPPANEPAKDLILVHTVQLKPMIKTHFSGRMVSSGISDVAVASIHPEKTCLKKLMMTIIINMKK